MMVVHKISCVRKSNGYAFFEWIEHFLTFYVPLNIKVLVQVSYPGAKKNIGAVGLCVENCNSIGLQAAFVRAFVHRCCICFMIQTERRKNNP